MKNQKTLLTVIILLLVGIFAIVSFEAAEDSPAENVAESVGEVTQDLGDSIEDAANQ